jgi:GT2 family glycosyltransferase
MYDATLIITTKNRKDELRNALRSTLEQEGLRLEVIVIDDGSTDGTADMVRGEFPGVRLERFEQSRGLIVQRNHAAKIASAPIIFSIDDDCLFTEKTILADALRDFDHPQIGAVTVPHSNINKENRIKNRAPSAQEPWAISTYVGCAHAVRRDVFLKLGGYREVFFHQGEESDYCARLLAAGYIVRMGRAGVIHHLQSPKRDSERQVVYNARNQLLFGWFNVPLPSLPYFLARTAASLLGYGLRHGYLIWTLRGLVRGFCGGVRLLKLRAPLTRKQFGLYWELRRGGPKPLSTLADRLDPLPNR